MSLLDEIRAAGIQPAGKPQGNLPSTQIKSSGSGSLLEQMQAAGIKPEGKAQIVTPQTQKEGFFKGLVKGAAKPFLEVGATVNNTKNAIGSLVKGGFNQEAVNQADRDLHQTYNLPFFGETKPALTGDESFGESVKKQVGYGAELASNFVPVGKGVSVGKDVIKAVGKDAIKKTGGQILKNTLKTSGQFAASSALGNTGTQLVNKDIGDFSGGEVAGSAAIGGLIPLTLGTGRLAGRGTSNFVKGVKNTIAPDVESALTKAIKPKANNFGFTQSLKTAIPDLQETAQQMGLKIENIDHLDDVATQAKKRVWANYENLLGPNANATLDGGFVADNIIKGVDKRWAAQNPQAYQRLIERANTYRRPISLSESEDFLQSANNELHSYYAKNKVGQSIAAADPELAPVLREADALREGLNTKLNELTGADAGELKRRYGALSALQSEIVPRKNVIARQNPVNLAEQIGYGRAIGNVAKSALNMQIGDALSGAADIATTKLLKGRNDSNNLIKLAFEKLAKNPRAPYAAIKAKPFIPAGYLPSPSYVEAPEWKGGQSGFLPQSAIQPLPQLPIVASGFEPTPQSVQNQFMSNQQSLISSPNRFLLQPPRLQKIIDGKIVSKSGPTIPLTQNSKILKNFLKTR